MTQQNLGHGDDQLDRAYEASLPSAKEMEAMYARHLLDAIESGEVGVLEDVGKVRPICDVCDTIAWERGVDGDPCPKCVLKWESSA